MGTGYTRNDTANNIADGNVINASDLDGEFDAVQAAFNASTGHSHDGTTGEGPQIQTAGLADDAVTGVKIDSTTTITAAGFTGPLTGNVSGNVTGNASTATALQTARTIAGQLFDGTANISIAPTDLTGVTASAAELNTMDGITASTAELNLVDGSIAGTVVNSKVPVYSALGALNATSLQVGGVAITATPAELNTLDGITASTAELNIMDGVTSTAAELNLVDGSAAGTVVNSKAAVYSAAGALNATSLQVGGVAITATPAELNTLDGITATTAELNYTDGVTSNIQTQLDGKQASGDYVTATGDTMTGALNFGDSVKAQFGASNDLQIYHDGSHSYVWDAGTGSLVLRGSTSVAIETASGETMATFTDNGAAALWYDNSSKLATTSTGVSVTGKAVGTLTTDNDLSFDMNASNQFKCTPTANGTLTFTNITAGQSGNIFLVNSGGYAISAAATTYISAADLSAISTAGSYFLSYFSDGTNVMVSASAAVTSAGA